MRPLLSLLSRSSSIDRPVEQLPGLGSRRGSFCHHRLAPCLSSRASGLVQSASRPRRSSGVSGTRSAIVGGLHLRHSGQCSPFDLHMPLADLGLVSPSCSPGLSKRQPLSFKRKIKRPAESHGPPTATTLKESGESCALSLEHLHRLSISLVLQLEGLPLFHRRAASQSDGHNGYNVVARTLVRARASRSIALCVTG